MPHELWPLVTFLAGVVLILLLTLLDGYERLVQEDQEMAPLRVERMRRRMELTHILADRDQGEVHW